MLLLPQYKKYILCFLYTPSSSNGQITNKLYIGKNTIGSIGYLHLQARPINRTYAVLEMKNIQCGNFIKGYAEQQTNRFILRTDIPDPRKDDDHQCTITFIQKDQKIFIIKEENCEKEHEVGCNFSSVIFSPISSPSNALAKINPALQKN